MLCTTCVSELDHFSLIPDPRQGTGKSRTQRPLQGERKTAKTKPRESKNIEVRESELANPAQQLLARTAEWLQEDFMGDELTEKRTAVPKGRRLAFDMAQTRGFYWRYPLEGMNPLRSSLLSWKELSPEAVV